MAYYRLQHGVSDKKNLLSSNLTYLDMLHGKLLDKGVNPKDAGSGAHKAKNLPRKCPVRVIGGQSTPAIENAASMWAERNASKHIKRKTGASDDAIDFWFNED